MKKILSLGSLVFLALTGAQAQAQVPDTYGNVVVGNPATHLTAAATPQNTAVAPYALSALLAGSQNIGLGFGAGAGLFQGSNNIYIGPVPGASNDMNITRLGQPGLQTSCYLAGTVIASNGVATYLTNFTGATSVSWTNTNSFSGSVVITTGVTNFYLTNCAGVKVYGPLTTLGSAFGPVHLQPGASFATQSAAWVFVAD